MPLPIGRPLTLGQIAEWVGGALQGDPNLVITDASPISHSLPGHLTFVTNEVHWGKYLQSTASAAIVQGSAPSTEKPAIIVAEAESAFAKIVAHFRPPVTRPRCGVSPHAFIDPTAELGPDVDVYPGVFIGPGCRIGQGSTLMPNVVLLENCQVGEQVTLFPNVVLYENTVIGDRCLIHAGAVLGAYGFGYRSSARGHQLTSQLGSVVVGADVDIGANTTIDRGTYDATTVGDGTKIDDQVMIGHNGRIGKHNLLCSQVGIAGSCSTGDFVVMAGQVGIGDHLNIGNQATLGAKSGVMHDIPDKGVYLGIPATPYREQMQILACVSRLPDMRSQLKSLTKQVERLAPASSQSGSGSEASESRAA